VDSTSCHPSLLGRACDPCRRPCPARASGTPSAGL